MCGWEMQGETQTREGTKLFHLIVEISGISHGMKLVSFSSPAGRKIYGHQTFNKFINSTPLFRRL